MADGLITALVEVVGRDHVLTDPDLTVGHRTDWTGRWTGACRAVVRPSSADQVAAVVVACRDHGATVVPQGGNTGLVGATVPEPGAIILSTRRLDAIGEVDDLAGQVTVGAGVTLAALDAAVAGTGWRHAVDLAARDSATIGGTVATNAGGHHVVRHGMTRRHVAGVEAVLADGSVVSHLGGLVKDNTGYDLAGLLCGSEGTLAVVTAVRLALVPDEPEVVTALVSMSSVDQAVAALGPLRRRLPGLSALELMFDEEVVGVAEVLGEVLPVDAGPAVLLAEVAGRSSGLDDLADALGDLDGVVDTAVADDPTRRAALWRWRDHHTETVNRLGATPPHKLDVTLPLGRLAEFVPRVRALVAEVAPDARLWLFGHAGDGNLHVNVTGLAADDESVDAAVLGLVAEMGGSISAEHGIGRAKVPWLHLNRSEAEIEVFRAIKRALDPTGLFSPGVLLPAETSIDRG